jgi:hypothetical protein
MDLLFKESVWLEVYASAFVPEWFRVEGEVFSERESQ